MPATTYTLAVSSVLEVGRLGQEGGTHGCRTARAFNRRLNAVGEDPKPEGQRGSVGDAAARSTERIQK